MNDVLGRDVRGRMSVGCSIVFELVPAGREHRRNLVRRIARRLAINENAVGIQLTRLVRIGALVETREGRQVFVERRAV